MLMSLLQMKWARRVSTLVKRFGRIDFVVETF